MSWLPVALVAVPLLGALALLSPATSRRGLLRVYGLVVTGATLVLAVILAVSFDYANAATPQFVIDREWAPGLALHFHLGVDGISLPLVVLTALLTFLCFLYLCWGDARQPGQLLRPEPGRPRALIFTLLVLEVGMIGTFLALDLLLFFVFFEIVLIPMYFVIAVWGGADRRAAALKFILYTLLGSVVLLLGLLLIWAQAGTLDMVALAQAQGGGMARGIQVLAFVAVGVGFAVKTPMWPLHTWLPDAHTEAPTVGSVLLAGVLLKMGTYGIARIAIPILPEGAAAVAPWLGALGVVGIIYGALACLAQRDLKRLIAYSSIGHMGFVLLGLATLTPAGMNAALFANIAHGLITGLLFFVAGGIKSRYGTADMTQLGGGMLAVLPHLGAVLSFACFASLGLPGLAGFWGEMLALFSAFEPAAGLPRPLFVAFMVIGGLGALLTAAYFLVMLSRVTHGLPGRRSEAALVGGGAGHGPVAVAAGGAVGTGEVTASADPSGAVAGSVDYSGEVAGSADYSGVVAGPAGTPLPVAPAVRHEEFPDERPIDSVEHSWEEDRSEWGYSDDWLEGESAEEAPEPDEPAVPAMPDLRPYELVAWTPLIVLTILFGLWPKLLFSVTTPAVQALLGVGS
ncbi:complex I subunit 4 family protein [Nonomuraea soli]|uniref:NADH-quinone oxidoreductase subunit M n=1 Tax=Nonomuraea soli TaxID=1032476 RepID=A0A7W0HVR7_9ACTN|nr:NADH-quinone oxidoreductase subunit M [Nonomuraea soli]MBA2897337.1 NADH-quinone oxidoreductase subunit M [Nonomuraea soli]